MNLLIPYSQLLISLVESTRHAPASLPAPVPNQHNANLLQWAIAGFAIGQVRTLQKFGILANAAVFINLLIMFITMGVFAHSK
jgi:hypothetical protein